MGGSRNHVLVAITVEIIGVHLGASVPQVGWMKSPVGFQAVCWGFPPTFPDEHIPAAILVDVAKAKSVGKRLGTGTFFGADGKPLPSRIFPGNGRLEPVH